MPAAGDPRWPRERQLRRARAASLEEALDELEGDQTFVEAFGAETVAQFVAVKRTEWARFTAHVTDWELDTYLPYL